MEAGGGCARQSGSDSFICIAMHDRTVAVPTKQLAKGAPQTYLGPGLVAGNSIA